MATRSRKTQIEADSKRFQELKADLARIEYFSKGTLLARLIRCGKPKCPCGADPKKRHGPYFEWTYKEQGKTVSVRLTAKAAPLFQAASTQYRKLKSTVARLEKLSRQAITRLAKEADSDSPHHSGDIFISPPFPAFRRTSRSLMSLACLDLAVVVK